MRDDDGVRVALLGNFSVSYSTESHVAASLESLSHSVLRIQEGEARAIDIPSIVREFRADVFLHIQTRGLAITGGTDEERTRMALDIKSFGIPYVAYHLDLFFGLDREDYVRTDPYFRECDYFFSTDGGHDDKWTELGVNHHWLPPGVFHEEAYDGTPRDEFRADVAFVGSHRGYAHAEHWAVREQMLRNIHRRYHRRFKMFPMGKAVRGRDLTDLYASVKVVIGDSCLAGEVDRYVSDRVPETMGRGGFLVHPHVEGLDDVFPYMVTYPAGDWGRLIELVDYYLSDNETREVTQKLQAGHTRRHHTYAHRMSTMLEVVGLA